MFSQSNLSKRRVHKAQCNLSSPHHQTSPVHVTINLHPEVEEPTEVGAEDEAKARALDLRIITLSIQMSQENYIATFIAKTHTMAQTTAPKIKKTLETMEAEKNA
jgi:hypothetical protein